MSNVLFVVAGENYRDEEYFVPAEILKNNGHKIFTASDISKSEAAIGADGGEVIIDYNINEVEPNDFDLIVFVGGPGALAHLDNEASYKLLQEAEKLGKKLAAICIAPVILAKAGVLKGKKATVWASPMDKKAIKILEENKAIYSSAPVISEEIITANGPAAAEEFGNTLISVL
ncbi:MAG: DJ-1/PfpI family protein [bacterium]|nr:DJ-1/PfpI family protein [bacterium]